MMCVNASGRGLDSVSPRWSSLSQEALSLMWGHHLVGLLLPASLAMSSHCPLLTPVFLGCLCVHLQPPWPLTCFASSCPAGFRDTVFTIPERST
jgi:hypothetical protein